MPSPLIRRTLGILVALAATACGENPLPLVSDGPPPGTGEAVVPVDLGTLGGERSVALDINDRGEVVGFGTNAAGERRAFVWSVAEGMREIGTLGGPTSVATAINNRGEVVGWSTADAEDWPARAFVWTRSGGMRALQEPEGVGASSSAEAWDINDRGDVVGYTGGDMSTVWYGGGEGRMLPCARGYPTSINNSREIVGDWSQIAGASVDLREYTGGVIRPGERCVPLMTRTLVTRTVTSINDAGMSVGWGGRYQEVRDEGGGLRALSLTDGASLGWTRSGPIRLLDGPAIPVRINNVGEVLFPSLLWTRFHGSTPLGPGAAGRGLNNRGDVVGSRELAAGVHRATLWRRAGRTTPAPALSAAAAPVAQPAQHAGEDRGEGAGYVATRPCPEAVRSRVEIGASTACGARFVP